MGYQDAGSSQIGINKLVNGLRQQRFTNNSLYCDVSVHIGKHEIPVHSCVMSIFSPFFSRIAQDGNDSWRTSSDKGVALENDFSLAWRGSTFRVPMNVGEDEDISSALECIDCFQSLIDYMYADCRVVPDNHKHHIRTFMKALEIVDIEIVFGVDVDSIFLIDGEDTHGISPGALPVISSDLQLSAGLVQGDVELRLPVQYSSVKPACLSTVPTGRQSPCLSMISSTFDEFDNRLMSSFDLSYEKFNTLQSNRNYTCIMCGSHHHRAVDLLEHLLQANHDFLTCSLCYYEARSLKGLLKHLHIHKQNTEKLFFCFVCGHRFSTRTSLARHLPRHSHNKPFICCESGCGRGFKWKHALAAHKLTHTKEKPLLCHQCGFSTAHRRSLDSHLEFHTGTMLKCTFDKCTFQTSQKHYLKVHMTRHDRGKVNQCDICGRGFSLQKNMRRHLKLMHNKDALPPLVCTASGCTFSSLRSDKITDHMRRKHPDLFLNVGVTAPVSCDPAEFLVTPEDNNSVRESTNDVQGGIGSSAET